MSENISKIKEKCINIYNKLYIKLIKFSFKILFYILYKFKIERNTGIGHKFIDAHKYNNVTSDFKEGDSFFDSVILGKCYTYTDENKYYLVNEDRILVGYGILENNNPVETINNHMDKYGLFMLYIYAHALNISYIKNMIVNEDKYFYPLLMELKEVEYYYSL